MSESAAGEQTPDSDPGPDTEQRADTPADDRPLAETGEAPERVDHVDVTEYDEVDPAALHIAESTSADEPPA